VHEADVDLHFGPLIGQKRRENMGWKFWEKKAAVGEQATTRAEKLPKPREIPEVVGRYLVAELGKDPDWVWTLKGVLRRKSDRKDCFEFRVFDNNKVAARGVPVRDYTSLDGHPELVLFEGWFDKNSYVVQIAEK
jgi:hypothetical protein